MKRKQYKRLRRAWRQIGRMLRDIRHEYGPMQEAAEPQMGFRRYLTKGKAE